MNDYIFSFCFIIGYQKCSLYMGLRKFLIKEIVMVEKDLKLKVFSYLGNVN